MVNVATPDTAFTVVMPERIPVPLAIATETAAVDDDDAPPASRIVITGCVAKVTPSAAPPGCVLTPSCAAGFGAIAIGPEVVDANVPAVKMSE